MPSPGDPPNPGIKLRSPVLQADSLPSEPPGKPKNTREGSLSLLQRIFLTQESNPGLPRCGQMLYHLSHQGSPCDHYNSITEHPILSLTDLYQQVCHQSKCVYNYSFLVLYFYLFILISISHYFIYYSFDSFKLSFSQIFPNCLFPKKVLTYSWSFDFLYTFCCTLN